MEKTNELKTRLLMRKKSSNRNST